MTSLNRVCCAVSPSTQQAINEFYTLTGAEDKRDNVYDIRSLRSTVPQSVFWWDPERDLTVPSIYEVQENREAKTYGSTELENHPCYTNMKCFDAFSRYILKKLPVQTQEKTMRCYTRDVSIKNDAVWDASTLSVRFGEIDSKIFKPFINYPDILVHEFGHAITHYGPTLTYAGQSGILNEHLSDVTAITYKHFKDLTRFDNSEWCFAKGIHVLQPEGSLRSMSDPGTAFDYDLVGVNQNNQEVKKHVKDDQVKHLRDYDINYTSDHGGVHKYSGIPNHAFYLTAEKITGYSWEIVGKIWEHAREKSTASEDFNSFARLTVKCAKDLQFNEGVIDAIYSAWNKVGIELVKAPFSYHDYQCSFGGFVEGTNMGAVDAGLKKIRGGDI